jgi:hypothetical protein
MKDKITEKCCIHGRTHVHYIIKLNEIPEAFMTLVVFRPACLMCLVICLWRKNVTLFFVGRVKDRKMNSAMRMMDSNYLHKCTYMHAHILHV